MTAPHPDPRVFTAHLEYDTVAVPGQRVNDYIQMTSRMSKLSSMKVPHILGLMLPCTVPLHERHRNNADERLPEC